jgi:putative transcriptional regulator
MNTISVIRKRLCLTQAGMAQELGVSQATISNYERGQTVPPDVAKRLIAYAGGVGLPLSYNDIYAAGDCATSGGSEDSTGNPGQPHGQRACPSHRDDERAFTVP